MTIDYYSKEVYGTTLYYFADAEQARKWNHLSSRKTITLLDMRFMAELTGVVFNRVFEGAK